MWFWKLTEPYVLGDLKDLLKVDDDTLLTQATEVSEFDFDSESESDDNASDCSDGHIFLDRFQHDNVRETDN